MKNLINIKGKWYILLLMTGGHFYVTKLFDINNEVTKTGIIWEKQPFFYQNEIWYGLLLNKIIYIIRLFKKLLIGDALNRHFT